MIAVFALACSGDDAKSDTGVTADGDADADADADSDADADTDTATPSGCQTDICVTYGAAVPAVASQITDAAATDPEFSADFAPLVAEGGPAVDAFKTSLANYITDAYGCTTGAYTGPSMVEAHTGLAITQQEYDDFITLMPASSPRTASRKPTSRSVSRRRSSIRRSKPPSSDSTDARPPRRYRSRARIDSRMFGLVGLLHLPVFRPLLHAGSGGCPVGMDTHLTAAQLDDARNTALAVDWGENPAASLRRRASSST